LTETVGIALGGGGAKGLAHISMLEVLDELGVRPAMIAGSSVGAIIGSLYASGASAAEIRSAFEALTSEPMSFSAIFGRHRPLGLLDYVDIDVLGRRNLFAIDGFLDKLAGALGVSTFEDLTIPLRVTAADFWGRREVVLDSGDLVPALAASFALPGVFRPVERDGLILIDGSTVNPVPYDLLTDTCSITVAIDVMGKREPPGDLRPSFTELIFNAVQIASKAILVEKMKARPPTVYVDVDIHGVLVLEFNKAAAVRAQAEPFKDLLRRRLEAALMGASDADEP